VLFLNNKGKMNVKLSSTTSYFNVAFRPTARAHHAAASTTEEEDLKRGLPLRLPAAEVHRKKGGGGEESNYDESESTYMYEKHMPAIGHGGEGTELKPRMVGALAGKKVIGAVAGEY
jgi:hypothetical protein